jgi:hypothetical protein
VSAATVVSRSLKTIEQQASHAAPRCVESASAAGAISTRPPGRQNHADIQTGVLPLSRPSTGAVRLDVLLVVLCRSQTRADHVAERVSSSPGGGRSSSIFRRPCATRTSYSNIQRSLQKGQRLPRERPERGTQYLDFFWLHVCYRRS